MLTIQNLKEYGANVDEGLQRCLDDEDFYLEMVTAVFGDDNLGALEQALASKDVQTAFELAHALKGVYANLALTPLYTPTAALTELLRGGELPKDSALIDAIKKACADLQALNERSRRMPNQNKISKEVNPA